MMLAVPKPFASLSSGLLARKGQARPAMRRQMTLVQAGDDLGWNDMGEPLPVGVETADVPLPKVLAEREELAESLEAVLGSAAAASEPAAGRRRAAFTLRLDPERHLRLRLVSASRRISAQRVVTEALDLFLRSMPELEPLAAGASQAGKTHSGD